jgi:hypothetical protein
MVHFTSTQLPRFSVECVVQLKVHLFTPEQFCHFTYEQLLYLSKPQFALLTTHHVFALLTEQNDYKLDAFMPENISKQEYDHLISISKAKQYEAPFHFMKILRVASSEIQDIMDICREKGVDFSEFIDSHGEIRRDKVTKLYHKCSPFIHPDRNPDTETRNFTELFKKFSVWKNTHALGKRLSRKKRTTRKQKRKQ